MCTADIIHKWISEVFASHCYKKIDVDLRGSSEKGDGYLGNISFVEAHVESDNGQKTSYDLVIKYGKSCDDMNLPIKVAYKREVFVYTQVIQAFHSMEKQNIMDQFMVKCFGTLSHTNQEVIILQNLKTTGYSLNDPVKPLDLNHLTLTMETYGKFHAFSFGLKQQKPEKFRKLFTGLPCLFVLWMDQMPDFVSKSENMVYEILERSGEVDLLCRLKKRFSRNFVTWLKEVVVDEDKTVLLHGDCWNNNLMFKYHDNQPVSCKFLDFQNSFVTSPIIDLSYHLFATASEAKFQQLDHLLKIYHQSLCQTLKQLGINEEVFTYDELICHWKKYSIFGFILATTILTVSLSDKEDAFDIADLNGEQYDKFLDNLKGKYWDRISPRIVTVVKYFLELES